LTVEVSRHPFGRTGAGASIDQFVLTNTGGVELSVLNYGGVIRTLRVPDRNGQFDDIVLGYDTLAEYEQCSAHFGCITGRYANRISNGRFSIDGQGYQLEINRGGHHLHGASAGFGKMIWQAEAQTEDGAAAVVLRYLSEDGHGGYPGSVHCEVVYRLTTEDQLHIEYRATTDKPTIVNLTNHSYFNLQGHQNGVADGVLGHELTLNADEYVPTDEFGIPLGGTRPVGATPLDFRTPTVIGARIESEHEQLNNGSGYDHNWVIAGAAGALKRVARVVDAKSGRCMEVETTQPGVQFYSGNHVDRPGKEGVLYGRRGALCLETQYFPDSPNQPDFPSTIVRPGHTWQERACFSFSTV
jgi:aldose 1-epimerase